MSAVGVLAMKAIVMKMRMTMRLAKRAHHVGNAWNELGGDWGCRGSMGTATYLAIEDETRISRYSSKGRLSRLTELMMGEKLLEKKTGRGGKQI